MRVLQLIDSLRPGGAERMAVNYANALSRRGFPSFFCCTRMEGLLKENLEKEVGYLFLEKKRTLDHKAFMRLRAFVKFHKIQIIQAHSSSYFMAVLVKWSVPKLKIIWHDHYGRELEERKDLSLKLMSRYFDGIIAVNEALKSWAQHRLTVQNIIFLKNFLPQSTSKDVQISTEILKGNQGIKIICVANLRPQKDHLNLLRALKVVLEEFPDVGLHLVGKDENDSYSKDLKTFIMKQKLHKNVFLYGEQKNVRGLMKQADIGVLSSSSEGLPVVLLEYGLEGLPVICTDVGEIKKILNGRGLLVPPKDFTRLALAIKEYLANPNISIEHAKDLHQEIIKNFSEATILPEALSFYKAAIEN